MISASKALGVGAQRGDRRPHPRHVAVVIGAEHVDQAAVAALELVPVVGDVGGQVGRFAVGADQDPVLVVAELGSAQPERVLAAVAVAALLELGERLLDLALAVEVALGEPGVEADPEALEGGAHALEDELDGAHADRLGVGGVDPLGGDLLGQVGDVLAAVAVLGRLPAGHPGRDREREALDLAAGVVDVVLAPDLVADRLEQPHQGVAVGGVAAAADVQRAGRVGGDELDQDPLGRGGRRRAEVLARLGEALHRAPVPGVGEEEVDEAGAGDLDPLDAAALAAELALELGPEAAGDVARVFAERRREQHRRVGAVVAELGLRRPVERRLGAAGLALAQGAGGLAHRRSQLGDRIGAHRRPTVSCVIGASYE